MASSFLKGLVTDYGKLGYQLWHRPLKMASLVYEREIGAAAAEILIELCSHIRKQRKLLMSKESIPGGGGVRKSVI